MKNILMKFKFQLSRAKVNVKVAGLRSMLLAVRCFIYGLILIKLNIWDKFVFQLSRAKVKVTVCC